MMIISGLVWVKKKIGKSDVPYLLCFYDISFFKISHFVNLT